ncbi:MAG: ABC transporter substrate-binding protein [Acidimicrobiales bacterium]|nr:ABC transporter substrate-binding protein [Acidimicrobiales bacterium]
MRRFRWLLAVLLAFSLVAAACGDDDDDTSAGGDDTAADSGDDGSGDDGGDTGGDDLGDDGGDDLGDTGGDTGGDDGGTGETPEATEIGITADKIIVSVMADVDNPFAPGLAQGNWDGALAWAHYVNENGGLAGREVEVRTIDTKLDITGAAFPAAIIESCENVFAIVGSYTLFDGDVTGMADCADMAGNPTGIPDLSVVNGEPAKYTNPTTFPVLPPEPPGGFARSGDIKWLLENVDGCCNGVLLVPNDVPSAKNLTLFSRSAWQNAGYEVADQFEVSGQETNYDAFTQALKDSGATAANSGLAVNSTVLWRKNVATNAPDLDIIWHCTQQCYDPELFAEGDDIAEGTYVTILNLPFEEADTNPLMQAYLDAIDATGGKMDGLGFQAFVQGIIFGEVIEKIIAEDGSINTITRARFLEAISDHTTNAGGLIGDTEIGTRTPSGCFIILQAQGGEFVRLYPEEPGTFDCSPDNLVESSFTAGG